MKIEDIRESLKNLAEFYLFELADQVTIDEIIRRASDIMYSYGFQKDLSNLLKVEILNYNILVISFRKSEKGSWNQIRIGEHKKEI